MNAYKVRTKGGRVIGGREAPRNINDGGSVSAFEDYVLATKMEKDVLREKLREASNTEKLLREARDRLSYAENRNKKLEEDISDLSNRFANASSQHQRARAEEARLSNLVQMLREENELQKGQIHSLTDFQASQARKIEQLKQSVPSREKSSKTIELDCECPICLEDFDQKNVIPVVWNCGHITCANCSCKVTTCPTCREVKKSVSEKCTEYLRIIELVRKEPCVPQNTIDEEIDALLQDNRN